MVDSMRAELAPANIWLIAPQVTGTLVNARLTILLPQLQSQKLLNGLLVSELLFALPGLDPLPVR
jgi:hypothetical protein